LNAYANKCASSGIQLKLVDAAHILPVSDAKSTDDTANGIALSTLHHRAYGRGLITFDAEYKIISNEKKFNKLKETGFDGGMEQFLKGLRPIILVPPAINDRPNVNFIREANKLRGW